MFIVLWLPHDANAAEVRSIAGSSTAFCSNAARLLECVGALKFNALALKG
jgi:hypothetical protein